MPKVTLKHDVKARLIGFLNREKDHLLSVVAMAERIHTPKVTGSLELVSRDLDFVIVLRGKLRGPDEEVTLTENEVETLVDIANNNEYANRIDFWEEVVKALS